MSLKVVFVATRRVRDMWGRPVWGGWEQEEGTMSIVEKLVAEVREAAAVVTESYDLPDGAHAIRCGVPANTSEVVIATAVARAIRKHFKDYEEVEAWTGEGVEHRWLSLVAPLNESNSEYNIPVGHILRPKPAPEPTLEELTRAALTAWQQQRITTPEMCDAMAALAEKLEKP